VPDIRTGGQIWPPELFHFDHIFLLPHLPVDACAATGRSDRELESPRARWRADNFRKIIVFVVLERETIGKSANDNLHPIDRRHILADGDRHIVCDAHLRGEQFKRLKFQYRAGTPVGEARQCHSKNDERDPKWAE
jgi:hypothetical protein